MENNNHEKQVKEIINEYEEMLEKFINQNSDKNFDEIVNEIKEKFDGKLKEIAEKKVKEKFEDDDNSNKKKTITCPLCQKKLSPNNKNTPITIKTVNFPLKIFRHLYYCRDCTIGIDPAKSIFNIYDGHKLTLNLAEEVVRESQKLTSFDEAQKELEHHLGIKVSESVITDITEEVGDQLHQKELKKANSIIDEYEKHIPDPDEENKEDCTFYILADGSMLSILENEGASWKENKLGMVFKDNKKITRTNGKNILKEKEYVSYLGSVDSFKNLLFKTAIENGYGTTKNVVFLGDGAQWIWNICEELFPDAVQILDYYHLKENVYDYGEYLYPNDEKKREKWAENLLDDINEGNIEKAIDKIPDKIDVENEKKSDIPNLKSYLKNNKNRVNYDEYKKKDYFIGSGAIESGNKKVIQQRLKQPGMHWAPENCQGLSTLRTKYCSNQWGKVKKVIYNNKAVA